MSTLTSTDMTVGNRSSTRRHAPPGGQSSFSVGWGNEESESVKILGGKVVSMPVSAPVPEEKEVVETEVDPSEEDQEKAVGLVVVTGEGSQHVSDCATFALAKEGVSKVVLVEVKYAAMLVGAAQSLLARPTVSGVLALMVAPPGSSERAGRLESALLQVDAASDKPLIPGVVIQASLLEAKAVAPNLAAEWAGALAGLLCIAKGEQEVQTVEPVHVIPAVPTQDTTDVFVLMDVFREALKSRGARGIFGLQRKFRIADDDHSGSISLAEFNKAIAETVGEEEVGEGWSEEQKKQLFEMFDKDGSGSISFNEFLEGVRGALNERRLGMVLLAFELLDADKSGSIDVVDISAKYNASKHPDVISGKRSEQEILREFLDTFDGVDKDGKVTYTEFCAYYSSVSASIDHDDYFELMMRNAWHISGGEGWCANSSNRRVLVSLTDGRQCVEEIKNDLGVSAEDEEAIWANLVSQGLSMFEVELCSGKKILPPAPPVIEVFAEEVEPEQHAVPPSPSHSRHGNTSTGASSLVLG